MHYFKMLKRFGLCAALAFPVQAAGFELTGFDQPDLRLSDHAGLPFYPAETHIFASNAVQPNAFIVARQQVAGVSVPTHVTVQPFQRTEKEPSAVALRATVLRRSETLVGNQRPQPILRSRVMPSDIMDSWSVGVFR